MLKRPFLFALSVTLLIAFFLALDPAEAQIPASMKAAQDKPKFEIAPKVRRAPAPRAAYRAGPPAPVHAVAEWEESEGVLMNLMNADLVNRIQEVNKVYVVVDNYAERDAWMSSLDSNSIPHDNMVYVLIKTDTVWTRDYGPWFVWDGNHEMAICDYNRLQIDAFTDDLLTLEPFRDKWRAFGWEVFETDGHDWDAIFATLTAAAAVRGKPAMVIAHTIKAKGCPLVENKPESHNIKVPDRATHEKFLNSLAVKAALPY